MKLNDFTKPRPNLKNRLTTNVFPKESIFDFYLKEKEAREALEILSKGIEGKKGHIERLEQTIEIKEKIVENKNNEADLAFGELELILGEIKMAKNGLTNFEIEVRDKNKVIFQIESTINDKREKLEEIGKNLQDIEEKKQAIEQITWEISRKRGDLSAIEQQHVLRTLEIEDFNKSYTHKINTLETLDLEIKNKKEEIDEIKNTIKETRRKKQVVKENNTLGE